MSDATRKLNRIPGWEVQREELAWAGGLFEGEGSISVNKQKRETTQHYVTIYTTLAMTDLDVLERFQRTMGIGNIIGPHGPYGISKKVRYSWSVSGHQQAQYVIALLWPWLAERRREQARASLAAVRAYVPAYRRYGATQTCAKPACDSRPKALGLCAQHWREAKPASLSV